MKIILNKLFAFYHNSIYLILLGDAIFNIIFFSGAEIILAKIWSFTLMNLLIGFILTLVVVVSSKNPGKGGELVFYLTRVFLANGLSFVVVACISFFIHIDL